MRKAFTYALAVSMALLLATCGGSPTDPTPNPITNLGGGETPTLAVGKWSGENVCLSVEGADVQLISGCWRGHFGKPTVQANGTFSIDGTYRFEAGPTTNEAANAHFTGKITGTTLNLTVQPAGGGAPVIYEVTLSGSGSCTSLCV